MFDIVFVNPPFDHITEFENIALHHSNKYVWMVGKTSRMMDARKFQEKKVVYFKNLGDQSFKEEIEICSYLIDKNKRNDDCIFIEGACGKSHITDKVILSPCADIDAWKFSQDVLKLNLKSYKAYRGKLLQREAKIVSEGVKCLWSSGGNDDIKWDIVDNSQKDMLYGLGHHMVFTTSMSGDIGDMGIVKYADPSFGIGYASIGIITESYEESMKVIEYFNSPQVKTLVKGIKLLKKNSQKVWAKIPHHDQKDKWFHLL